MKKIKFVSIETLLELKENNEPFVLVEALGEKSYNDGHIPGAVHLQPDKVAERAPQVLKKSDRIIVYCAGYGCHASTNVTRELLTLGYKNVADFKGGKKAWVDAGLGLEK